jgi:predicted nuclease of predicted toxin-antitoxin system
MTTDEDFAARSTQASTAPVIVWLRVGNTTNLVLRTWIEARLPGIMQLLDAEKRLIEVV